MTRQPVFAPDEVERLVNELDVIDFAFCPDGKNGDADQLWKVEAAPTVCLLLAHAHNLCASHEALRERVVHLEVALHKIREYNYSGPFLSIYIKEILEAGGGCCTPALRTEGLGDAAHVD